METKASTFGTGRPAFRWIRTTDKMPPLGATDGLGDAAVVRVKLFNPTGAATWYLTEFADGTAFGLVTGMGDSPELGYIDLNELWNARGKFGLRMERDIHFTPKPLSECK